MATIPWWLGALALATVSVGYFVLLGRAMGVSGSLARVVHFRATRQSDRERAALTSDLEALAAALHEATRAEFGDAALADVDVTPMPSPRPIAPTTPIPSAPWRVHVTFIVFIFDGAL